MINLTKETIVIRCDEIGLEYVVQPSGIVAQVEYGDDPLEESDETQRLRIERVTGLPAGGRPCLVTLEVMQAVGDRSGVMAPDPESAVVDETGRIVAYRDLLGL